MLSQSSPKRKICLECLLSDAKWVHLTRAQRARGSTLEYFLHLNWGIVRKESGDVFWTSIGASVCSLSWISSAILTLSKTCLQIFWKVHFAMILRSSYVLIFPDIAKKDFSCQIRPFLYRQHFWNAFQAKDTPCGKPVLRQLEAGHCCLCHNDRRIWCWTEARVAFLIKRHWDGVLIWRWMYKAKTLLSISCLLEIFWWNSPLFVWNSLVFIFPACANKTWTCPICCLWKENNFEMPFRQWKETVPNQGYKAKRDHFFFCAIIIGDV